MQTAWRKVHTVFQLLWLLLLHEYFIRQYSRRYSCLSGWKRWGVVHGRGIDDGPVSSSRLPGNTRPHILSLGETLACISGVAQLLLKCSKFSFFRSCLTLLTLGLVIQLVQICCEFFLLPCWISQNSCLFSANVLVCSPRFTCCLPVTAVCSFARNTREHASLSGNSSDHVVTFFPRSHVFLSASLNTSYTLPCRLCAPALFHIPAPQWSLGRPCFSNFLLCAEQDGETREKGKAVKRLERMEEEMDAKQAEKLRKMGSQGGPWAGKRGALPAS